MADEDIISTLPDAILCHILSFLETKESAVTSILSNRWKYLWLSVPSLYFKTTLTNFNQNFHFNDNVYTVLHSRNSPVKSFRLEVTYDYPETLYLDGPTNSIAKWINFVVQSGVDSLDVRLFITDWVTADQYLPKLPVSIVTCKTLVVLKLCNFDVEKGFSSVVLPSLKVLDVQHMRFPKLRDFMLFLTACPILEHLIIYNLYFNSDESLTYDEWNSFCLSNLTLAAVDCFHHGLTLKAVQNVPRLAFVIDPVYCRYGFISTFHNLTHLTLGSLDSNWQFLLQVLNHCPKLQQFEIDEGDPYEVTWTRKDDRENWVDPDFVPQCLSLHLRTCNLYNFLDLQGELQLARYILKNAKVLQKMTIWNRGQPKIYNLLSSCPTASPTCILTCHEIKETTEKNNDDDDDDSDDNNDDDDDSDDDDNL